MEMLGKIIPDRASLLAMPPEQLANVILQAIRLRPKTSGQYHRQDIVFRPHEGDDDEVKDAISVAWHWMLNQGILIPDGDHEWRKLSPEGRRLLETHAYDAGALPQPLPRHLLHPIVVKHAEQQLLSGQPDEAVLAALRRLEIAVRDKIGAPPTSIGTDLMREAFHLQKGPLRDPRLPRGEQENEAHMFAGIMGSYRNAVAHREVQLGPVEAAQVLVLVSLLLSIVDSRPLQP